jgi:hypothetical protein
MSFTAQLKGAESQYKLVSKVVRSICESNSLNFETVWSTISNRECEYFDRHFKRNKRKNDPLRQVKKPRTAFSFFTQANRNEIQTKHPNLSFGEVSKLVGEQWKNLDEKARAKYIHLETEDKARYTVARGEVMKAMATAVVVEPVATEPVAAASVPAPKKAKVAKQAVAAAAPVAAAATSAPAKAKKTKQAAVAAAPAPAATEQVAAAAPVAEKKEKKSKSAKATTEAAAPVVAAPVAAAATAPVVAATSAPKKEKKAKQAAVAAQ